MEEKQILGIDVGASGIKGAIVDLDSGELITERIRIETPQPATPEAMAQTVIELVDQLGYPKDKPVGCGFPAVIKKGVALSAANIDPLWIGTNVEETFGKAIGSKVYALNDADAAGIASLYYGDGKGHNEGTVILITVGSGLGSALFTDGVLVRNTELGHFTLEGQVAEHYASANAKKRDEISWEEWGYRFDKYLLEIEKYFSPDLILLGGGGSKKFEKYQHVLTVQTPIKPDRLLNKAGIVGAAYHAYQYAGLPATT